MNAKELNYLITQYYNMFSIPIRLCKNGSITFSKGPFLKNEDPVNFIINRILNYNCEIGYVTDTNSFYYGFVSSGEYKIIAGPVSELKKSEQEIRHIGFLIGSKDVENLISEIQVLGGIHPDTLLQSLIFINYCINKTMYDISDIRIKKSEQENITSDIKENYSAEKVTNDSAVRSRSYLIDREISEKIKNGDVEGLKAGATKVSSASPRNFAPHLLRHTKNFFIRLLAICSFSAVSGGVSAAEISELEELYITKCESLNDLDRIKNLQYHMILDMAERVKRIRMINPENSKLVNQVTNYIRNNITEKISTSEISEYIGKSRGYVTTEFKKATGINLSDYISELKVNEARDLLKYTDKSFIEISNYLGFSSQSYFIRIFKKITGDTPKEYRIKN